MSKKFKNFFSSFLALFFIFLLSGCENFLKTKETKEEIIETIRIANSSPITYFIIPEDGSGSAAPTQVSKREKESFDILFTPNPNNEWQFIEWEVVDRTCGKIVTDAIKFQDPANPETTATIIKPQENLKINPKCVQITKITDYSPAHDNTSYTQDTPIKITFNKAIQLTDFSDDEGFLKNISIKCGVKNLLRKDGNSIPYYKNPYLENDNKTLVIPLTKGLFILDSDENPTDISVSVNLSNISNNQDQNISTVIDDYTFTFTINSTKDSVPPEITQTFIFASTEDKAKSKNSQDHFLTESFYDYANSEKYDIDKAKQNCYQNVSNNKIWIHGIVRDLNSGVAKLVVEERLIRQTLLNNGYFNTTDFQSVIPSCKTIEANNENFIFSKDGKEVSFCFEYTLQTTLKGIVNLNVSVFDYAGNQSSSEGVDIIFDPIMNTVTNNIYINIAEEVDKDNPVKRKLTVYSSYGTDTILKEEDCLTTLADGDDSIDYTINNNYLVAAPAYSLKSILFSTDGINYKEGNNLTRGINRISKGTSVKKTPAGYASFEQEDFSKDLFIKVIFQNELGYEKENQYYIPYENAEIISIQKEGDKLQICTKEAPVNKYILYFKKADSTNYSYGATLTSSHTSLEELYKTELSSLTDQAYDFYIVPQIELTKITSQISFYTINPDNTETKIKTNALGTINGKRSITYRYYTTPPSDKPDTNKVPSAEQFSVTSKPNYGSTGTHSLKVSYTQDFTEDPDLVYFVKYNGIYTTKREFDVPSQIDYSVSIVARNSSWGEVESQPLTIKTEEDTIPPEFKVSYKAGVFLNSFTVSVLCNKWIQKLEEFTISELKETIEYWWVDSTNYTYEDLRKLDSYKTKINKEEKIIYYNYYDSSNKYLYAKFEDQNGNFSINKGINTQSFAFTIRYSDESPEFEISKNEKNEYVIVFKKENSSLTSFEIDSLNENYNWTLYKKGIIKENTITLPDPSNSPFIKIYNYTGSTGGGGNREKFSIPIYVCHSFYTDQQANKNIVKNVIDGELGLTVFCDNHSFTHTLVSPADLGTEPSAWELRGSEFNLYYSNKSYNYNIPLDDIKEGFYYTTITYFADGSSYMRKVLQK